MKNLSYIKLLLSMVIFGTIGLLVRNLSVARGFLAMSRGFIGVLFLLPFVLRAKKCTQGAGGVKGNLLKLFISGAFIGFNWILLFESYSFTTVARSTLSYYMAPVFVVLLAPIVLKDRLTLRKIICVAVALVGMCFVSGVLEGGGFSGSDVKGILLALGAAALYASVTLINKRLKDIEPYEKTAYQLFFASLTVLPYTLIAERQPLGAIEPAGWVLILVLGIVHTGLAYALFFSAIPALPAHSVAVGSYIDPVVAVILSATLLSEGFTVFTAIGAVLIIAAALVSELKFPEKTK